MPNLNVMFKINSLGCNLNCAYCYSRRNLERKSSEYPFLDLLKPFIPQYMDYVSDVHQSSFSWQGGEPTLAGIDFFKGVINLEARNARPPMVISNVIQTNGILINDEWAELFSRYNFLVGVSLDGPEQIHNAMRKDIRGKGSFKRVMQGIDKLRKNHVDFNILCVVGPHNVDSAPSLMQYFSREGFSHLQFMPAMNFQATEPDRAPDYLISSSKYGEFLMALFDDWYRDGLPQVSIRMFDNFLASYLGRNSDLCVHNEKCNSGIVIEDSGDVYPCDFFISGNWRLGNIRDNSLEEILKNPLRDKFINQKLPLPEECLACKWLSICHGECARNRPLLSANRRGTSYFCTSYKMLFGHAGERLLSLSNRIRRYQHFLGWQSLHKFKPGDDELCPCGSGERYKLCCGDAAIKTSYLFH